MGIPELWGFTVLAFVCVVFISSKWWFRGLIALAFGVWLGMIGINPYDASDRFTFGWYYLADSVQIVPVAVGLFAIPEMIAGLKYGKISDSTFGYSTNQTKQAFIECWKNRWLSLRGGLIGAVIGLLPHLVVLSQIGLHMDKQLQPIQMKEYLLVKVISKELFQKVQTIHRKQLQ